MAELPGIERETLELDVVIVGAGIAGLATAYHLNQLAKKNGTEIAIGVLEKGQEVGAHGISGAVMDPRGFDELMPDWKERDFPMQSPVTSDQFWYMTEKGKIKAPINPPVLNNHGNYVVSMAEMLRWFGAIVGEEGIDIFPEFPAARALFEDGRVVGVRTADKGIDKNGAPKGNFEPGVDIRAKIVILAEGARGTITKQLAQELDLYAGRMPQVYSLGVKEIWQVPEGRLAPGAVIHTLGWPLDRDTFGGGFIYGMKDNLVDIGLVVGLDYRNPKLDPHAEFQRMKTHPQVRKILEGGKMIAAGAKAIPEGGLYAMPRMHGDGFLIVGDSAGYLNGARLKGIHLAIKSGMLAAETALAALASEDTSATSLSAYEKAFEQSWARAELWKQRNFHQGFEKGQFAGMLNAGLGMITGGRGFGVFSRLEGEPGHARMRKLSEMRAPESAPLRYDNEYLFDKVTDVYYGGVIHEENQPAHLLIRDTEVCITRCTEEYGNPCQNFCPAAVYEVKETEDGRGRVPFLNFTNCFHFKTCDIMDPYQVITWVPPEGGGGPRYEKQ